jgi:hypothetical protein
VHVSPLVFHRAGRPIGDIRKTWKKALEAAELPSDKSHRKLFHDFRRTAARDMVRAGVPQSVAMSITGHKTVSMFLRYKITDGTEQRDALSPRLVAGSSPARGVFKIKYLAAKRLVDRMSGTNLGRMFAAVDHLFAALSCTTFCL